VAFEPVRAVTYTRSSGAWELILQAINVLCGRGSGHVRLAYTHIYSHHRQMQFQETSHMPAQPACTWFKNFNAKGSTITEGI